MRLILTYDWCVPHEASGTETLPVEYESAEALLCDFDEALETASKSKVHDFEVASHDFEVNDFIERGDDGKRYKTLPSILTIDEWFPKK